MDKNKAYSLVSLRLIVFSGILLLFSVNVVIGQTTKSMTQITAGAPNPTASYTLTSTSETVTFTDNGGAGNYTDAVGTSTYTFYPPAGHYYLQVTWTSLGLSVGKTGGTYPVPGCSGSQDSITVYYSSAALASKLGAFVGATTPGTLNSSSDCSTGALVFKFHNYNAATCGLGSPASTNTGWSCTVSVATPPTASWVPPSSISSNLAPWNTASNWNNNAVPNCYTDVTINGNSSFLVLFDLACDATTANPVCRTLTIGTGGELYLDYNGGTTLRVYGTVNNSGYIEQMSTNTMSFQADGATTNNSSGNIYIDNGSINLLSTLSNAGTINYSQITSTGALTVTGAATNTGDISANTGSGTLDFTNDFTNSTGTLTYSSNSALVKMRGNVSNNGTINHTTNTTIQLLGSGKNFGGTGDFSNSKFQVYGTTPASYTLQNSITTGTNQLYKLQIDASGSFSLGANTLQITNTLNQVGTLNLGTGELRYNNTSAPTLANATFAENMGTFYYNIATNSGQIEPGGITYYNLKVNNNGSAQTIIGNSAATVCNDFTLVQGGSPISGTGGAYFKNILTVNNNFTIGSGCQLLVNNQLSSNALSTDYTIYIGGNFTNNGVFVPNGYNTSLVTNTTAATSPGIITPAATVIFNGTGTQTISGTYNAGMQGTNFYNLTLNKTSGQVNLGSKITVKNTLALGNGKLYLMTYPIFINRATASAITNTSNNASAPSATSFGCIVSEDASLTGGKANNAARVKWYMGNTAATYIFPFGVNATEYIPFTFTLNSGTFDTLSVGTYRTASDITPLPIPVANVNNATPGYHYADSGFYKGINNATYLVQRFWQIDPSVANAITKSANVIFTYAQVEIPSNTSGSMQGGNAETNLRAQRWNADSLRSSRFPHWSQLADNEMGTQASDITNNTVTVTNQHYFSPWAISQLVSPLPIKLLKFTAVSVSKAVLLNWATATETNNKLFVIERSIDGVAFAPIASLAGAGNSGSMLKYSTVDNKPALGINYYRLKQIDFDGKFTYSKIIALKFDAGKTIDINYDRSNGELDLSISPALSANQQYEVKVFDISGRQVRNFTGVAMGDVNNLKLPCALLPGSYIASFIVEGEAVLNKQIMAY